jgi:hypothetical protein
MSSPQAKPCGKEKRTTMTFTIDPENDITAYASNAQIPTKLDSEIEHFTSEKELAHLASNWPMTRLVDIWNSLAGVIPIRKFTDRKKAIARIWRAIQSLAPASAAPQARTVARAKPRKGKKAKSSTKAASARERSKKERVLEMLRQPDGATLVELMAATEWQAHSVRGFLSGTLGKKMGLTVESAKRDKERVYSIAK